MEESKLDFISNAHRPKEHEASSNGGFFIFPKTKKFIPSSICTFVGHGFHFSPL